MTDDADGTGREQRGAAGDGGRDTPPRPSRRSRALLWTAAGAAAVLLGVGIGVSATRYESASSAPPAPVATGDRTGTASAGTASPTYTGDAALASLPPARYNAVIAGLVPFTSRAVPLPTRTATISEDAPLYGADRTTPVARLDAVNFLGQPTVIVPVRADGDWTLILTPARQRLPSANGGHAPAQTAAWIRTSLLTTGAALPDHLVLSSKAQTLSIVSSEGTVVQTFPAGVGASGTPTPTGVVGYIQARYLDPAQEQTVHPINLTSLHSAAADEPYGGQDGGLIGVHYYPESTGAISHGCVRLATAAIDAVNRLPVGTLVVLQD